MTLPIMIKYNQAIKIILKNISSLKTEIVNIRDSLDRILAEDIYSEIDVPGFDNSAMDGYALSSSYVNTLPCRLTIKGESKAGCKSPHTIKPFQAMRIMTGAIMPKGADTIVKKEDVKINKDYIIISKKIKKNEYIRRQGEAIKKGELVIKKGILIKPVHMGIMASIGRCRVRVTKKPKIAIITTGDEIQNPSGNKGQNTENEKTKSVFDSNSYSLYGQVIKTGAVPICFDNVKDRVSEIYNAIKRALKYDLIITSGGVSMGDYDFIPQVFDKLGGEIKFWKVAVKPGKPVLFGKIKNKPFFGLPGNPVSSMVAFDRFVRPAILKMLEAEHIQKKQVTAVLTKSIEFEKGLCHFIRGRLSLKNNKYKVTVAGKQGSGILPSLIRANSFIIIPEDKKFLKKGDRVLVEMFD